MPEFVNFRFSCKSTGAAYYPEGHVVFEGWPDYREYLEWVEDEEPDVYRGYIKEP